MGRTSCAAFYMERQSLRKHAHFTVKLGQGV